MKKLSLFIALFFSLISFGQTHITLTFLGKDAQSQQNIPLQSIYIKNTTIGCDTTIYGSYPSITMSVLLGIDDQNLKETEPFIIESTIPNPFNCLTSVFIYIRQPINLYLKLVGVQGTIISEYNNNLNQGLHKFEIRSSSSGYLMLVASDGMTKKSVKLISQNNNSCDNSIIYSGKENSNADKKNMNYVSLGFVFHLGDQLLFKANAVGYGETIITDSPVQNNTYTFQMNSISVPTVITDSVINITQTTATSGGNVTSDGGGIVTSRGVCWSLLSNPTTADSHTIDGNGTGVFTSNLTGLTSNTTYHVKAYATNSSGTSYGNDLIFISLSACGQPITYEGQTYNTVQIGTQCWFKENLNVGTQISHFQVMGNNGVKEKYCYDNLTSYCNVYGALYQWDEAMQYNAIQGAQGLCPLGWHIPTQSEWNKLVSFLGGDAVAGGKMKEQGTIHWDDPNVGASNSSGFTALGSAYSSLNFPSQDIKISSTMWSSTEMTAQVAYYCSLYNNTVAFSWEMPNYGYFWKDGGAAIRCIKNGSIIITTSTVTNITPTSAVSGGDITSDGGVNVTARGVCWSTSMNPTIADNHTTDGGGTGLFISHLTGLSPNTTYYVRAYGINSEGTYYGNYYYFNNSLPTVTTTPITNISDVSATSGGNVISGNATVARGVCWGTSPNPTTANSHTNDGTGTGTFISQLTGLTSNTLYYVRAYASNSVGTAYGDDVTFTTIYYYCPGIPTITYEGKIYHTVKVGDQCWLKENLNVGVRININQNQSNNGIKEKYCHNDLESNCDVYGGFYQWNEAMQYTIIEGSQGLCPSGWHIPADADWTILTTFLGGESVAGGKLKEIGTTHWASPNTGATNSTNFTALPGDENSNNFTHTANFWTSKEDSGMGVWSRSLRYDDTNVNSNFVWDQQGYSIRCLKN